MTGRSTQRCGHRREYLKELHEMALGCEYTKQNALVLRRIAKSILKTGTRWTSSLSRRDRSQVSKLIADEKRATLTFADPPSKNTSRFGREDALLCPSARECNVAGMTSLRWVSEERRVPYRAATATPALADSTAHQMSSAVARPSSPGTSTGSLPRALSISRCAGAKRG